MIFANRIIIDESHLKPWNPKMGVQVPGDLPSTGVVVWNRCTHRGGSRG